MDFKRSQQLRVCDPYPIYEQINSITSFVDASMVYGSEEERALELRQRTGGLMRIHGDSGLLPFEHMECEGEDDEPAFAAGKEKKSNVPILPRTEPPSHFGRPCYCYCQFHI